jgi:hypothetical protein
VTQLALCDAILQHAVEVNLIVSLMDSSSRSCSLRVTTSHPCPSGVSWHRALGEGTWKPPWAGQHGSSLAPVIKVDRVHGSTGTWRHPARRVLWRGLRGVDRRWWWGQTQIENSDGRHV